MVKKQTFCKLFITKKQKNKNAQNEFGFWFSTVIRQISAQISDCLLLTG